MEDMPILLSSLVPLTFLYLAAYLNQRAVTPPKFATPPPVASNEAIPTERRTLLERTIYRNVAVTNFIQKAIVWTIAGTEIVSLVLSKWIPSWRLSGIGLRFLFMPDGHPERIWQVNGPLPLLLVLGTTLVILGGVIRLICFRTMGEMFTFEHTVKKEHRLMTTGPYSFVRHPSYTGMIMILVGTGLWQACPGSWTRESGYLQAWPGAFCAAAGILWLGTLCMAFILRSSEEDAVLSKQFGEEWNEWAKIVRYRLVPGVY
ncbi:uncharacterized protein BT62DRAFT_928602 [Guyanagaster necrorhizus]|uniref:Protein-S-isoprenylcysteine O-methyltransferase n=1 Tax=Guyanagaster necrorhizus TaxID=856835 RepID=A0A9P8AVR7_9AGAR|nr:uncharacterized protein BT62DRAFT_928602 [Guyanagaster necrorhizus MCA 3950]KAG7449854.1 hypothetical protein BT62DRAFT_928602 [Guyanagaster necrorhizus MCA 3950]